MRERRKGYGGRYENDKVAGLHDLEISQHSLYLCAIH